MKKEDRLIESCGENPREKLEKLLESSNRKHSLYAGEDVVYFFSYGSRRNNNK